MPINPKTGLYELEQVKLVNTREFTRTAQQAVKNGSMENPIYTKAHPKFDRRDYEQFWDEEERRRREGYSVGGVHISGKYYGFLNFAQILRTSDTEEGKAVSNTSGKKVTRKQTIFPSFWDGHYQWFTAKDCARNEGYHVIGGKARRKGFSYVGAWDAADTYDLYPKLTTIIGAFDNKYLIKGDGTMAMAKKYLDFLNKHTDWRKSRLKNTADWIKAGYKPRGSDEEYGFLSQIISVSFKDNPDAAAGKDAVSIQLEELGIFPNLSEMLDITLPTLEAGETITGQITAWGTGGTKGANWEVFEEIFYNPMKHGFMAFDNVWDENSRGNSCGFFFPHIQNLEPHMDEDGNSLLEQAKASADKKREDHLAISNDIASHNLWVGQRANKPSEAFSRSVSNIFSSKELSDHIQRVKTDPNIKYLPRCGQLTYTDRGVRLATNEELIAQELVAHPPLFKFPHKTGDDVEGCFVEWQPPYRDPLTGRIPKGLYRIWNDPYAQDKDTKEITLKNSLGATYVYERPNIFTPSRGDILVAAYVGRPAKQETYNDGLIKVCQYYGGEDNILMFENDRGDVKPHFSKRKVLNLLANEPDITWKKELQGSKNREKGIMINVPRKGAGAIYLKDWLYTVRGKDENGNVKLNLHYIYDLALLLELEKWKLDGNFDRVSCMIVGQFDMKEQFEKEIVKEGSSETGFFDRVHFK